MSAAGIYGDEDSQADAVFEALVLHGFRAVTSFAEGMNGSDDDEQLEHAVLLRLPIFTANARDFGRIHNEWSVAGRRHFGIVIIPKRRFPFGEQIRRIEYLLRTASDDQVFNNILWLTDWAPPDD